MTSVARQVLELPTHLGGMDVALTNRQRSDRRGSMCRECAESAVTEQARNEYEAGPQVGNTQVVKLFTLRAQSAGPQVGNTQVVKLFTLRAQSTTLEAQHGVQGLELKEAMADPTRLKKTTGQCDVGLKVACGPQTCTSGRGAERRWSWHRHLLESGPDLMRAEAELCGVADGWWENIDAARDNVSG